jgi:hypothetical protein
MATLNELSLLLFAVGEVIVSDIRNVVIVMVGIVTLWWWWCTGRPKKPMKRSWLSFCCSRKLNPVAVGLMELEQKRNNLLTYIADLEHERTVPNSACGNHFEITDEINRARTMIERIDSSLHGVREAIAEAARPIVNYGDPATEVIEDLPQVMMAVAARGLRGIQINIFNKYRKDGSYNTTNPAVMLSDLVQLVSTVQGPPVSTLHPIE